MLIATLVPVANRLLTALPPQSRRRMLKGSEPVELLFGTVLCERGERIRHVYFPTGGFISLLAAVKGNSPLEVGLIGNEGMLGVLLALGVDISPTRAVVQGAGGAMRMPAATFRHELAHSIALRHSFGRYAYVLIAQLARTTACLCFHVLEARLAQWLLLAHDRAPTDRIYATHASLAELLGVHRSGVTLAARELQRKKLIRYSRGNVTVIDRKGLEKVSCECYGIATANYSRILG